MILAHTLLSLPHFYTHRPRVVGVSTNVPSSLSKLTYGLCPRPRPLPTYGLPSVGTGILETNSYPDVVHPE